MKHHIPQRYPKREMIEDAIIVMMPSLLMLMGVLWFFKDEWIHSHVVTVLISFVDSFFVLLTSTG